MIVKELLVNSLSNAGHILEGETAETDELALALRKFNFEIKRLANRNLITAFQRVVDIDKASEEQVIGKMEVKRGYSLKVVDRLEDPKEFAEKNNIKKTVVYSKETKTVNVCLLASAMNAVTLDVNAPGREEGVTIEEGCTFTYKERTFSSRESVEIPGGSTGEVDFFNVDDIVPPVKGSKIVINEHPNLYATVKESIQSRSYYWFNITDQTDGVVEFVPDVFCNDVERIVNVMFKNSYNQWENLRFVPLSNFYTENDDYIYCTTPVGENKVKLILPRFVKDKEVRVIYNADMEFDKFDRIDVPDAHLTMIELATTVAILIHDADADTTRLNNYQEQLNGIMKDIMSNTATERRIQRSTESVVDNLRSGSFIRRRIR